MWQNFQEKQTCLHTLHKKQTKKQHNKVYKKKKSPQPVWIYIFELAEYLNFYTIESFTTRNQQQFLKGKINFE